MSRQLSSKNHLSNLSQNHLYVITRPQHQAELYDTSNRGYMWLELGLVSRSSGIMLASSGEEIQSNGARRVRRARATRSETRDIHAMRPCMQSRIIEHRSEANVDARASLSITRARRNKGTSELRIKLQNIPAPSRSSPCHHRHRHPRSLRPPYQATSSVLQSRRPSR